MAKNGNVLTEVDNGWLGFSKMVKELGRYSVFIGVQGEVSMDPINIQGIAAVHEFGHLDGHVKDRSFIRSTMEINQKKYAKQLREYVKAKAKGAIATKGKDIANQSGLIRLGEGVRKDMINRIRKKEIRQELAESTINDKSPQTTALIRTGRLVGSITSKLVKDAKKT